MQNNNMSFQTGSNGYGDSTSQFVTLKKQRASSQQRNDEGSNSIVASGEKVKKRANQYFLKDYFTAEEDHSQVGMLIPYQLFEGPEAIPEIAKYREYVSGLIQSNDRSIGKIRHRL